MKLHKNTVIAMILALVVIGLFIALGFFGFRGFSSSEQAAPTDAQAILDELAQTGTVADLRIIEIVAGSGEVAERGDVVVVHYTGVLPDGTVFDSSVNRGEPFSFELGSGLVIQGWERGVAGMKVGEKRLLVIPPSLVYGSRAAGTISANSTLIFEVELLEIRTGSVEGATIESGE